MTDLPEGFEGYIRDKYKMNPVTFKLLYENKYNSDLAAYTAGITQGRRGQAEEIASRAIGYRYYRFAEEIRRATGEQG